MPQNGEEIKGVKKGNEKMVYEAINLLCLTFTQLFFGIYT